MRVPIRLALCALVVLTARLSATQVTLTTADLRVRLDGNGQVTSLLDAVRIALPLLTSHITDRLMSLSTPVPNYGNDSSERGARIARRETRE